MKGFSLLMIIILVAIIGAGGYWYVSNSTSGKYAMHSTASFDESRFVSVKPISPKPLDIHEGSKDGSCSKSYYLNLGKVFWGTTGYCGLQGTDGIEVPGADVSSFLILPSDYDRYGYARDEHQVYFEGHVFPADSTTFRILNWSGFVLDKNAVYPYGKTEPIAGADPFTFENVHNSQLLYRDKNNVYCKEGGARGSITLVGANPKTIEEVVSAPQQGLYAKDVEGVYDLNTCTVVPGANPADYPAEM